MTSTPSLILMSGKGAGRAQEWLRRIERPLVHVAAIIGRPVETLQVQA